MMGSKVEAKYFRGESFVGQVVHLSPAGRGRIAIAIPVERPLLFERP